MNVYLVMYDLKQPGRDYALLYETLKTAASWWHYLESTWLLASPLTMEQWQQQIRGTLDQNDLFMIIRLDRGVAYTGWLPQKAWEWMQQNLGS
jgi:hypothetical protein